MPKPNKNGVQGLYKNEKSGRYHFDLRFNDPKTGEPHRHKKNFPPGISHAAAKERARALVNALLTGTYERDRAPSKRLREAFDEYLAWADANRAASADDRRNHATAIIASVGDLALDAITPFHIERFKT